VAFLPPARFRKEIRHAHVPSRHRPARGVLRGAHHRHGGDDRHRPRHDGTGISTNIISVGSLDQIHLKSNIDGHKVEIATKGTSDLYVVDNVIAPGGNTGWHSHPGPSLVTVKAGTITQYEGDDPSCTPEVFTAGESFVDPGGDHVHILRNEGTVPPRRSRSRSCQRAPRRIDMPAPATARSERHRPRGVDGPRPPCGGRAPCQVVAAPPQPRDCPRVCNVRDTSALRVSHAGGQLDAPDPHEGARSCV
jgi:quercetin dioxygenase-like cupin family protein